MPSLTFQRFGLVGDCHGNSGECVRLKNFVTGAKLTSNTIQHCGLYDYKFGDGKNGEGIYIGTSTNQVRWHDYGEEKKGGINCIRCGIRTIASLQYRDRARLGVWRCGARVMVTVRSVHR